MIRIRKPASGPIVALCAAVALAPLLASADMSPFIFGKGVGSLNLSFTELDENQKTGDFVIPGEIVGKSSDTDFRADRANGNTKSQYITLIGHVVIHTKGSGHTGPSGQPLTLTSDQLRYDYRNAVYTATGNVKAVQGGDTLTASVMRLDDVAHVADLSGNVRYQAATGRTIATDALTYHIDGGDFVSPGPLTGGGSDGTFSADSASGNGIRGDVTLVGDVVVHKLGGFRNVGNSSEPITLTSTTLVVQNDTKQYTASGHVKVVQGDRTMTAPLMRLDDNTHVLTMTGGVHASQPPSSSFEAPEVIYNTETEDFRALGGVHATVPVKQIGHKQTPRPSPKPSPSARL